MARETQRRLAAIVLADVVGYSRLMGADETGTLEAMSAHRQELWDPTIERYGGRVVNRAGDSALIEFTSAVAAVECSVAIQTAMAERNKGISEDKCFALRVGVNVGEVVVEGEEIYGDGVNIAARLQTLAQPGTICISGAVYEQISGKVTVDCSDLGEQALKNIERPVRVFSINCGATAGEDRKATSISTSNRSERIDLTSIERPSIVVMPFKDLGGGEQDSLAEGIRLSLHSIFIKLSGLFLVHTATVEKYRGAQYSPNEVGKDIDVQFVIDGAVQRSGDRVRITIELTDTSVQQLIMSERYDRVIDDIFDLQDELALEIVNALDIEFRVPASARHQSPKITKPLAREYFHRGISHFYRGTKEDNLAARDVLEKLIEIEPDIAAAVGLLGISHWRDAKAGWSEDKAVSLKLAEEYAQRTIDLGDPDGLGNTIKGNMMLLKRQYEDALEASSLALERRPSCPLSNALLAEVLQYVGKPEDAVSRMKQAMKLSRIFPPWMLQVLASSLRDNREFDASIDVANQALKHTPDGLDTLVTLCCDYSLSSRPDDAASAAQEVLSVDPSFSISYYAERLPYKDEAALQRVVEGLSLAGLPD